MKNKLKNIKPFNCYINKDYTICIPIICKYIKDILMQKDSHITLRTIRIKFKPSSCYLANIRRHQILITKSDEKLMDRVKYTIWNQQQILFRKKTSLLRRRKQQFKEINLNLINLKCFIKKRLIS
ncbi:unnamed protein product [Paramecium sonneborni]|uniref:Uncharacterized protein n=1 Tax=Paramecium sonneborni TaxID=65129 RepID=A0A8S1JX17_9CILI|nr:unnamed protein product [Paramecium sonneborni]